MQDFKFKLLGMTWQVKGVSDDNIFAEGYHGLCVPQDCTIYFAACDAPDQQRNTLIHESLHAIERTLMLDFEEEEINALAAGIHELIQNPEWLKAVKGK